MRWSERFSKAYSYFSAANLRRDEIDFLPAALEIVERPASPAARFVALAICVLGTVALIWTCIGKVDVIATAAGRIVPTGNSKLVQPAETGVIAQILTADGDHVSAGQILIELDPSDALADKTRYSQELAKIRLEIARLRGLCEIANGRPGLLVAAPADAR